MTAAPRSILPKALRRGGPRRLHLVWPLHRRRTFAVPPSTKRMAMFQRTNHERALRLVRAARKAAKA